MRKFDILSSAVLAVVAMSGTALAPGGSAPGGAVAQEARGDAARHAPGDRQDAKRAAAEQAWRRGANRATHARMGGLTPATGARPARRATNLATGVPTVADTPTRWRPRTGPPDRPYPRAEDRRGGWMLTASGRQYWPCDPHPHDVCIEDKAASLSKQCRFAGHIRSHYSVAEHSVLVSLVVPPEHALQALMHDAAEAYCVDVPRPLKIALGSAYADIEELNWLAICERFDIDAQMHPSVKRADDAVLLAERDDLCAKGGPMWSVPGPPAAVAIECFDWPLAQYHFLRRFHQLTRGASS